MLTTPMPQGQQHIIVQMMTSWLDNYKMDPEKEALIKGFLRISRDDLEASRLLHERELFALAVYHLQQAVEKATKAQILLSGRITVEEIRGIRHDSLRGQQIFANKLSRYVKMLAQATPGLNADLSKLDELRGKSKRREVALFDGITIDTLIAAYDSQVEHANLPTGLASHKMETIFTQVLRDYPEFKLTEDEIKEARSKLNEMLPRLVSSGQSLPFLFVASVLTSPHWMWTRYPDGDIKPWEYQKSMGIVSRMPQLIDRVDKVLESMEAQVASAPK